MLTFFQLNLRGQSEIILSQNFGGAQDETFQDISITPEDGALLIGYGQSNEGLIRSNKGLYDMLVCEMGTNGNVLWSTNIGGSDSDLGKSILVHEENTFIAGLTYSTDQDIPNTKGGGDIIFGNLDNQQQFDARSVLGGNKLDNIVGLKMMLDGSIIVVANSNSTDVNQTGVGGATDIYVCRMLANGVVLWETKFGSSRVDKATDIVINGQDEIIIVGSTYSEDFLEFKKGIKDGFVLCINNTGEQIWGRRFGNGNYTGFTACDIDAQNNILISGTQGQINNNNSGILGIYNEDIVVFKLNEQGEQIWQRQHGGMENDFSTDIISTLDGGTLIVGNTLSYDDLNNVNYGGHDAFALKLDPAGQKEWSKTYGGSEDDLISTVRQDRTGQYWLVGKTGSSDIHLAENNGGFDAWVLKLKGKAPQLSVELGNPIFVCEGEQVNIDASLNNCDCSYTWSDGVVGAVREFTAFQSETLSLTVNDETGNVASDDIRITVSPRPIFELNPTDISCAGGMDGALAAITLTESTSLSYAWSVNNSTTSNVLSNLGAGEYQVTVTNENNCSSTRSITISEPEALEANAEIVNAVCESLQGEILVDVSGGMGTYQYTWSSGQTSNSLVGVGAGEYQVTITDGNDCSIVERYTIEQIEVDFELEFDITANNCNGFEAASISILNNSEISDFEWSTGESSASISNLEAGEYTLDYTTNNGCAGQQTFTVTEPTPINVQTTVVDNNCGDARDGSISLNISGGTGPYILAWVNGESTTHIEDLTSGAYSVTINDDNGCVLILEEDINAPDPIVLEEVEINHVLCTGANVGSIELDIAGGTGSLEYIWSNGSDTQNLSNLSAGQYTVTVIDELDCLNIFEFDVDGAEALPEVDVEQNDPLCFEADNGFVSLTAANNISYLWPDGFVGNERDDLAAGAYEIVVGNDFGCTKMITVTLSEPTELDMSFNLADLSCFDSEDGRITVNPTGGTTPYTLTIENSASQVFDLSGDQTLSNLAAGLYFIQIEDANGCFLGLPLILKEPDAITIDATLIDVSCFGEMDGQITTNVTGGTGEYSYFWDGGMDTQTLSGLGSGSFQVEVSDENNCVITDTYQVNEPTLIEVLPALIAPSSNNDDGRISLILSGGVPPYNVNWVHGAEGPLLENVGGGTYEYTITDASGCMLTGSILLESPNSAINKEQITEISIFPNPTNQDLYITTDIDYRDLQMNLHNALGQLVRHRYFDNFSRGTHSLPVAQLPSGIYYLSLSNATSQGVYKVVVDRP